MRIGPGAACPAPAKTHAHNTSRRREAVAFMLTFDEGALVRLNLSEKSYQHYCSMQLFMHKCFPYQLKASVGASPEVGGWIGGGWFVNEPLGERTLATRR